MLRNVKLPKLRKSSKKGGESQPSSARFVSYLVPENNLFGALGFCHRRGDNLIFDTFLSQTFK